MRIAHVFLVGGALALTACSGGSDTADDTNGPEVDPFETCASTDGESPSILAGVVSCLPPHQDGEPPRLALEIEADDPQGAFTLKSFGGHKWNGYIAANDQELFSKPDVTCSQEDAGTCVGTLDSSQVGVDCGNLTNYKFTAVVVDDDGNESVECEMTIDD